MVGEKSLEIDEGNVQLVREARQAFPSLNQRFVLHEKTNAALFGRVKRGRKLSLPQLVVQASANA
jgi:hypothetical protein